MTHLFVYGTLREKDVQLKYLGRMINDNKDSLGGFTMSRVIINETEYPILIEDVHSKEIINGMVLEITNDELIKLDEYETNLYVRKRVRLKSGKEAWVYKKG